MTKELSRKSNYYSNFDVSPHLSISLVDLLQIVVVFVDETLVQTPGPDFGAPFVVHVIVELVPGDLLGVSAKIRHSSYYRNRLRVNQWGVCFVFLPSGYSFFFVFFTLFVICRDPLEEFTTPRQQQILPSVPSTTWARSKNMTSPLGNPGKTCKKLELHVHYS